jgi:hypothetical protein
LQLASTIHPAWNLKGIAPHLVGLLFPLHFLLSQPVPFISPPLFPNQDTFLTSQSTVSDIERQVNTRKISRENITSAEKIAGREDVLTEILLRLPVKFIVKFKYVCKPWFLLVSSTQFCYNHNCKNTNTAPSGLFFPWLFYVSLRNKNFHQYDNHLGFPSLEFLNTSVVKSIQSCNGLLPCSSTT